MRFCSSNLVTHVNGAKCIEIEVSHYCLGDVPAVRFWSGIDGHGTLLMSYYPPSSKFHVTIGEEK